MIVFPQIVATERFKGLNGDILRHSSSGIARHTSCRANLRGMRFLARANILARAHYIEEVKQALDTSIPSVLLEIFYDLFALSTTKDGYALEAVIQKYGVTPSVAYAQNRILSLSFSLTLIEAMEHRSCASYGTRCHKWPETIWKLVAKVTRAQISIVQSCVAVACPSSTYLCI